jgi:hypothetical protein
MEVLDFLPSDLEFRSSGVLPSMEYLPTIIPHKYSLTYTAATVFSNTVVYIFLPILVSEVTAHFRGLNEFEKNK